MVGLLTPASPWPFVNVFKGLHDVKKDNHADYSIVFMMVKTTVQVLGCLAGMDLEEAMC